MINAPRTKWNGDRTCVRRGDHETNDNLERVSGAYADPHLRTYQQSVRWMMRDACAMHPPPARALPAPLAASSCSGAAVRRQKHLRCTIDGPDSSYSCLEIHICWKVESDDRIEPPIHTEYFRSGGAMIFTFIEAGASAVISLDMRSAMPAYMVVPPDSTTFAYRSLRMSTSHFMIELYVVSWTPGDSMPRKDGWKRASGQRKRSLPMVMTWPSGSSYDFSRADDWVAVCISWSKSSATYASFSLMSRTISRSAVVVKA